VTQDATRFTVAQHSSPERVVILAPNWLGDAVMALPAIDDVHRALPNAHIVVAARRSIAELFRFVPSVNSIVTLQSDARWWRRAAFKADADALAATGAEIALLLPNSFATAWLVRQAHLPERWGYATDARSRLLTRAVARPKAYGHQVEYYRCLTRELGIPTRAAAPTAEVSESTRNVARELLVRHGHDGRSAMVVLAPGAAYGKAKQWLPSHVTALIARLVLERQLTCVLVGGRGDAATGAEIRRALPETAASRVVDLMGKTTLEELGGVLASAAVCVSNDSGAMHLAAAVGVPVVAVFGPTNEQATAPLGRDGVFTEVITHDVWCRPCMLRECPIDHRCMAGITPDRVFTLLIQVLDARARSTSAETSVERRP
jgi:heptosyltransferase-2